MPRFTLEDYPWDRVAASREFITDLYRPEASPSRPGVLMHYPPTAELPPPPSGLDEWQRAAWTEIETWRRRPVGEDDFVPALSTSAGTCAMATAFGGEETETGGVCWVKPVIGEVAALDHLRKPAVTAGKLGRVLARTEAYAACADPRIAIRVMDFQSPFTTCEQLLGSELFFTIPYDDPRRLHALMDLVTDFAIEFFQEQMRLAGSNCCPGSWPSFWFPAAAGIQMSDDNMVNVSPEIYEEFVVPYNNRIAAAFGGLFLHSCTIKEANLAAIGKIVGLTGINCDISTSVTTARLLAEFGDQAVVAPHAYVNTDTNFVGYGEFMTAVLAGWRPGLRLFIHPCSRMYIPALAREIAFDRKAVLAALAGG